METYSDFSTQKSLIVGRCRKCLRLVRAGGLIMPQDPDSLNVYLGLLGIHYEKSKPRDLIAWLKWRKDPERNCMGHVPLAHPSHQAIALVVGATFLLYIGIILELVIAGLAPDYSGAGIMLGILSAWLYYIIPDGLGGLEVTAQAIRLIRAEGRAHE